MSLKRHILAVFGLVVASPALALTPLPAPCSYNDDKVEGLVITYSTKEANQFVTYEAYTAKERVHLYLEHCPTGKILRSKSAVSSASDDSPRSHGSILDTVSAALTSETRYTMSDIRGLLKDQGVATKRYRSKSESCACQHYFPEARGDKTPYGVSQ